MTTIYEEIAAELETHLSARERRHRAKFMRELVLRKLGLENQMFFPMDRLDDYGPMFESYMREWRHVMAENPSLRGHDYEDGKVLADQFEVEVLGMEAGHERRSKVLTTIAN